MIDRELQFNIYPPQVFYSINEVYPVLLTDANKRTQI